MSSYWSHFFGDECWTMFLFRSTLDPEYNFLSEKGLAKIIVTRLNTILDHNQFNQNLLIGTPKQTEQTPEKASKIGGRIASD
jgi:hypothetical protein